MSLAFLGVMLIRSPLKYEYHQEVINNEIGISDAESKPNSVAPTLEIEEFGIEDFSINAELSCEGIELKIVLPITVSIGSSDIWS